MTFPGKGTLSFTHFAHNIPMWAPETLEFLCADAWQAVTVSKIGDWRLRAASGFTGRANSVLAVGVPGVPVGQALDRTCEFARAEGISPRAQVIDGSETEREIAAAGWVPHTRYAGGHLVSVLVGPLGAGAPKISGVSMRSEPSRGWWELAAGTAELSPAQRHVLTTGEIGFGVVEVSDLRDTTTGIDGTDVAHCTAVTVGAVRAAVTGDVLLVARLAVRPGYRRRGLATALMVACGPWAAGRGATACVLQVAVTNAPALALYARLGFREHHRYRYWVPGPACEDRSL